MNDEDYRKAQEIWVQENNIEPGVPVVVIHKTESQQPGWPFDWFGEMDLAVDREVPVHEIHSTHIVLDLAETVHEPGSNCDMHRYRFPFFVLVRAHDEGDRYG